MKIYLASALEPENFGPGKVYTMFDDNKPDYHVDGMYRHFIPKKEVLAKYKELKLTLDKNTEALKLASEYFNKEYRNQLKEFGLALYSAAKEEGKTMIELLPFEDGDTLISWERFGNNNFRGTVAALLKKIGYEVFLK